MWRTWKTMPAGFIPISFRSVLFGKGLLIYRDIKSKSMGIKIVEFFDIAQ